MIGNVSGETVQVWTPADFPKTGKPWIKIYGDSIFSSTISFGNLYTSVSNHMNRWHGWIEQGYPLIFCQLKSSYFWIEKIQNYCYREEQQEIRLAERWHRNRFQVAYRWEAGAAGHTRSPHLPHCCLQQHLVVRPDQSHHQGWMTDEKYPRNPRRRHGLTIKWILKVDLR